MDYKECRDSLLNSYNANKISKTKYKELIEALDIIEDI